MINRQGKTEYETIDLSSCSVDARAVEKIPRQIAERYTVLAVSMEGSQLTVATCNPMDLYALEDIRLVTNMRIQLVLCGKEDIESAIALHYSELDARTAATHVDIYESLADHYVYEMLAPSEEIQAPIVRLLNSLLLKAYNTNVSDIHIEPYETEVVIRMRRDGILQNDMTLPLSSHRGLIARTKILAHMDIAEKRRPQDGHFKTRLHDTEMHVRVSFVPTVYGEKGVLRFLTMNTAIDHQEQFGMTRENYETMLRMLKHPHGIIYFTGPTGCGKTTTLYAILEYLSHHPVNIVTIEDPVERCFPKLNQIQVNERADVTFDSMLRSVLRQDPDIIMVGETRDLETASTSVRAAITGHLVCSTLHTNDTVSAAVRLMDMGVPGYMIASSVVGVVAQRLVRKACRHCCEEYEADERELELLFGSGEPRPDRLTLIRSRGCRRCDGTGYRGRVAVHEMLEIDRGLRKLIAESRMVDEWYEYARNVNKISMLKDEVRKLVLEGITDLKEMERIVYGLD